MSAMQAEIRRRLWATILKLKLQSAIDSGMPLLISVDDFDTEPPTNVDDLDLDEGTISPITPRPSNTFTQTSIQIALLKTFQTRLDVVRYCNSIRDEASYDDVLRVGAKLAKACRENNAFITKVNQSLGTEDKITQLQRNLLAVSIRRFLLLVHRPFAAKALKDPHYFYSRQIYLDSAVIMLRYPTSGSPIPNQSYQEVKPGIRDGYVQLKMVVGGFFKGIMVQVATIIFAELYNQLQEDATFPEDITRSNQEFLKGCLREITDLSTARIAVGENNIKGHLFISIVLAQLEAMEKGIDSESTVLEVAKKSADFCYGLLYARAEKSSEINASLQGQSAPVSDMSGLGCMQELGMDFTMQYWTLDQNVPQSWVKCGFEDGMWWHW